MFILIGKFLLLSFIVEAITEILVARDIFKRFREFLEKKNNFLFSLFNCGACTSVWIAILICYVSDFKVGLLNNLEFFEPLLLAFAVHRGATYWHQLYNAFRNGPRLNINTVNVNQNLDVNSEINEDES